MSPSAQSMIDFRRAFYLRSTVIDERQRRGDDIGVVERERERERESRQSEERGETRDESAKGRETQKSIMERIKKKKAHVLKKAGKGMTAKCKRGNTGNSTHSRGQRERGRASSYMSGADHKNTHDTRTRRWPHGTNTNQNRLLLRTKKYQEEEGHWPAKNSALVVQLGFLFVGP